MKKLIYFLSFMFVFASASVFAQMTSNGQVTAAATSAATATGRVVDFAYLETGTALTTSGGLTATSTATAMAPNKIILKRNEGDGNFTLCIPHTITVSNIKLAATRPFDMACPDGYATGKAYILGAATAAKIRTIVTDNDKINLAALATILNSATTINNKVKTLA